MAFVVPLLIGLYFSKKHGLLIQVILIGFIVINVIALYFSYTRAAWLSVVAALIVWIDALLADAPNSFAYFSSFFVAKLIGLGSKFVFVLDFYHFANE